MAKSLTIKNIRSIMDGIASEHPQINTILKGNTASNEVDVQNECSLIALDVMSIFENYNKAEWSDKDVNLVLNKTWSIQPFTERFDSLYSGAAISMSVSTNYGYARCQIPT